MQYVLTRFILSYLFSPLYPPGAVAEKAVGSLSDVGKQNIPAKTQVTSRDLTSPA